MDTPDRPRSQAGEMRELRVVDAAELAAWTAVARVVLNWDETITKE